MSIKAMTWAFGLPLEPRAKIALLAIADNARDDGIAWPSRDTVAEKSSQSRATVKRRLKMLVDIGVLSLHERFREDGTQTTDEIRLYLAVTSDEVMRRMQTLKEAGDSDDGEDEAETEHEETTTSQPEDPQGGGVQPAPPGVHCSTPGGAVLTGGGVHSGTPQDEPSLEPRIPPNPPLGGPLSKTDREAAEKRSGLWERFAQGYPEIGRMDQQEARSEFDQLSVDDAEWAVSVLPHLKELLAKPKAPSPKNAHLWLRKGMFRNFPRTKIEAPNPEQVWIPDGSPEDRALRFVRRLCATPSPFGRTLPDGSRGYYHKTELGPDLLAMLEFESEVALRWTGYPRGTAQFAAWQTRFRQWIGQQRPTEPGSDCIRVPCQWPPKKDGTIYHDDQSPDSEDSAA